MVILDSFFWVSGVLLLLVMVYLWFLAVASLLPEKKRPTVHVPRTRFAVLIPAHNEADLINFTLDSTHVLDYPTDLFAIFIIADNCTDQTAGLARSKGSTVLERHDETRKGKGYALSWAFEHLKETGRFDDFDAFVIIDADTIFDSRFLKAMDIRMRRGEQAIQGYYDVLNPDGSPMASLSYLGFALNRNLKYVGRTKLGWPSNLLGNGMCFSKEVIGRFGWYATSIVEDMEYAVMLALHGVRVSFAPEALVFAEIPETFGQSRIQRSRWDIGRFQVRNRYVGRLVKAAVRTRDMGYLDTAMELIIPPFSIFVVLCFCLFGLFLACLLSEFDALARLWFTVIIALMFYIMLGLSTAKADWKIYANLVYAPFFLFWRVTTIFWGYIHKIGGRWIKTERKNIL